MRLPAQEEHGMTTVRHHNTEKRLRLDQFPCLNSIPFETSRVSAWHIRHRLNDGEGAVLQLDPEAAYFAMIYLRPVIHCDLLADGQVRPARQYDEGSICLVDLSQGAAIRLSSELDGIGLVLPVFLLSEIAERFPQLNVMARLRRNSPDLVLYKLGRALLPFLRGTDDAASPALQHILAALCLQLLVERRSLH
jgi:hypothetical protein